MGWVRFYVTLLMSRARATVWYFMLASVALNLGHKTQQLSKLYITPNSKNPTSEVALSPNPLGGGALELMQGSVGSGNSVRKW